jgi:hypothetical protein
MHHEITTPTNPPEHRPPTESIQFYDRTLPLAGDYVYTDAGVFEVRCKVEGAEGTFTYVFALADPYTGDFHGLIRVPDVDGIPTGKPDNDWPDGPPADDLLVGIWQPTDRTFNPVEDPPD